MQNFLNVVSFAVGIVSPIIVESALENGLPAKFGQFLETFVADETGAFGSLAARQRAMTILEANGVPATEEEMRNFITFERAYNNERRFMKLEGLPFEGFEDQAWRNGDQIGDVNIGFLRGSRANDAKAANKLLGLARTPEGWTWHHHPDFARMILVPAEAHAESHWGGVAIWKALFGIEYP